MKQKFEIIIHRLGIHGEGIGYENGCAIFVDGALPTETVEVELYEKRKKFGFAKALKYINLSSKRVTPPCSSFGTCGGCQLMHLEYSEQLLAKRQRVIDALHRIGKLQNIEVLPCYPSPTQLHYRNKIQLIVKNRKLGFYARNTHDFIEVSKCFIHCPLGESVFQKLQHLLLHLDIGSELKSVSIRTAVHLKQVLVTLITDAKKHSWMNSLADALMSSIPEIKGVMQQFELRKDCYHFRTIKGADLIEEKLMGLSFKISSASFFQVNPLAVEILYQKVVDFLDLKGNEVILDAYCGVGTLSLILAKGAKKVIGIEVIPQAIENARENALYNQISNVEFRCERAEEWISHLKHFDIAVMNPSRQGCQLAFLEGLIVLKPLKIVYISCDPATLARDLHILCLHGYSIDTIQPIDMFPQTAHVETIVTLNL